MAQTSEQPNWAQGLAEMGLETGDPLTASIKIDASRATIWGKLTQPGHLKRCHPFCDKTEVMKWPGAGSKDSITYYSGRRYERNFVEWLDGVGYDIELGERPNVTSRVLWRINPLSESSCELSIEVVPSVKSDMPAAKKKAYQERLFGRNLQHYLECVVRGVEYWIRTGEDVREDQFGSNPLYSAA